MSALCGFLPKDNRGRTGSIHGVLKKEFVMGVSLRDSLCKMGGFRSFIYTALVFLVFQVCLVSCDITDGNAEHLKREHSLMKPYQGKIAKLARKLTCCFVFSHICGCFLENV